VTTSVHHIDCECIHCAVVRCIYVLLVAKNRELLSDEDFEIGQLILSVMADREEL
jgi:hypothetical protein